MRVIILAFILLGLSVSAQKQTTIVAKVTLPELSAQLTSQPQFPGGIAALDSFISRHLVYPQMEKDNDISGTVKVRFMVDENGDVKYGQLLQHVSPGIDKEALRALKQLPKWVPGMYNKKPVPVYYTLNINFAIQH